MSYIYYDPEDYGLETVAEYSFYEPDYDFDLCVVWRDKSNGSLWGATDTGCSCPVPFEDHKFPGDFTEIRCIGDLHGLLKREPSSYRRMLPTAHFVRQVEEVLHS